MNHREPIQERFLRFHLRNPHVFQTFVSIALEMQSKGKRVSAKTILEGMRWEVIRDTDTDEPWKMNNDYFSRYARLAMDSRPELEGYFETRRLTA